MSENNTDHSRPEIELPDEIMAVIPTDPYDQLDLARKITSMAIATRVTMLETEVACLKQKLSDKYQVVVELEDKLGQVQEAFKEAELRLKVTRDDNTKLLKERDTLAVTAKKLSRDLAKLEAFKRQLMQSLSDDSSSQAETVDISTYDQSVSKGYDLKEGVDGSPKQRSLNGSTDSASAMDEASRKKFDITQYVTPRHTPIGTPKGISTSGSPRGYSSLESPQKYSGVTSPTKSQYEGSGSISSWFPSSQQSSASNSPRGRPLSGQFPRISGKEFFRHARSRLSYEQFSAFLANIKELNAKKQSREETLRKAEEIFGVENKELYLSFQSLLSRNMS